MENPIRQPIVVVLGHVDSGKTSLLDKIRGTAVQKREVGGITQHIGASFFPIETLVDMCESLLSKIKGSIKIPGLLVIDTPGHEVFTNLRTRGGSAADISILVVDVNKGIEPQTIESLTILKNRQVPFILALNKIDMISGWKNYPTVDIVSAINKQDSSVSKEFDGKLYSIMGALSSYGFDSELFFRIKDFTKEISIVPTSAQTGAGIPELITTLIGLTQQYLSNKLIYSSEPEGIILEIKEELGLGHTANIILINGSLNVSDEIIVGKKSGPVITKIKAIFLPKPLDEMRDPRDKFTSVNVVNAAAGVKLVTTDLENVLPGSPIFGITDNTSIPDLKQKIEKEFQGIFINTDSTGIILKCDTIGSLESIVNIMSKNKIPIRLADIGPVTRRNVVEANAVKDSNDLFGVILAFGVKILPDAVEESTLRGIKIFSEKLIYNILDIYLEWIEQEKTRNLELGLSSVTLPCKFKTLSNMLFRQNNPAVFGVEIIQGILKQKVTIMNHVGRTVGTIHQIQHDGKNISESKQGTQVAISMNEPTFGRHIKENEILYTVPNNNEIKLLKEKFQHTLSNEDLIILEEIISLRKQTSLLYGL